MQAHRRDLPSPEFEKAESWPVVQELRIPLHVKIALPPMRLVDVQRLSPGSMIVSTCSAVQEVPLFAAGVALSWCEFAVADGMMAARLTRLG